MTGAMQVSIMLLLVTVSDCAVITGGEPSSVPSTLFCTLDGKCPQVQGCMAPLAEWDNNSPSLQEMSQACEWDVQCGAHTCCAISLWLRGLRICTPLGQEGEACHPSSHKVPFFRKRQHHTCPCSPNLLCSRFLDGRYRCSMDLKNINF